MLPTIALGLEHLDVRVREAALVAIASNPWPESSQLMQKALGHWDPATRRIAAREIGLMGAEDAVPSLIKILTASGVLRRDYELKKAIIGSLRALHAPAAVPALERLASRRFAFGKKERELRYLAREALEAIKGPGRAGHGRTQ
jgi:HEAT repeat protein